MSRPTAGISINGRAPGWESSRTSRPVNNSCHTFASSSNTWPRRVSHRKPSATTWTTSGALAARSSATCTMTKLVASFPLSDSSDSLSMNLVVPPFTTAQTISSVPSTPLAASCIGSLNPDPRIPQTSLIFLARIARLSLGVIMCCLAVRSQNATQLTGVNLSLAMLR